MAQIPTAADDEEEYEPDFEPEDAEQIINKLDGIPASPLAPERISDAPLAPYKLPQAPPLSIQEAQKHGDMTVQRAFGMLSSIGEPNLKTKITRGGFNRLAASNFDRDSWVTMYSRLATRASAGLEDPDEGVKSEYGDVKKGSLDLSEVIRDSLYKYIMYDWKKRIDVAISWLNEEWYNDAVLSSQSLTKRHSNGNSTQSMPKGNYQRCALRLLDGIITYIEGTDKVLVRFISEIPGLDATILGRMKKMAEDPERIDLAIMVLQYLYMFRPPVREKAVDVLVDMWRTSKLPSWIRYGDCVNA
jgi:symplekin